MLKHALMADHSVQTAEGPIALKRVNLGNLVLPTGRIVALDPLAFSSESPFTRSVPPGSYPVYVTVAQMPNEDQRVAFAMVEFRPGTPTTWEMALTPGADPSALNQDEFFGYGVDAGTGAFIDADTLRAFDQRMDDPDYMESLLALMDRAQVHTWSHMNTEVDPRTGGNLVAFSSGWGDGYYPSYFGLDEQGACYLVTDFLVLDPETID